MPRWARPQTSVVATWAQASPIAPPPWALHASDTNACTHRPSQLVRASAPAAKARNCRAAMTLLKADSGSTGASTHSRRASPG